MLTMKRASRLSCLEALLENKSCPSLFSKATALDQYRRREQADSLKQNNGAIRVWTFESSNLLLVSCGVSALAWVCEDICLLEKRRLYNKPSTRSSV